MTMAGPEALPAGGILLPRETQRSQWNPSQLNALRERLQPFVTEVVFQLPQYAPFKRSWLPEDATLVPDQVGGQTGQLVAIYSLLVELKQPVLVLPLGWEIPSAWVVEQLVSCWVLTGDRFEAIYVQNPSGKVPYPLIMGPRLVKRLNTQVRRDPPELEHFLRQIDSRRIEPGEGR